MFTKFYLGILAAAVLAAGSCYALFSYSYGERQQDYYDKALKGSLSLIQDTLPTLSSEDQQAYLNIAFKLFGASLLSDEQAVSYNASLKTNNQTPSEPIMLSVNSEQMIWAIPMPDASKMLVSFPPLSEQQFRAQALLLISHLKGYAKNEDVRLARVYSAFDVNIVQPSQLGLDPQQLQDLRNNRVVVRNLSEQDNRFSVLAPMGKDKALRVGPIPVFEALPMDTALMMLGLAFAVFIGVAYWLIYLLASRIKPIDNMVEAFGEGELEARISIDGKDHFSGLANRINSMATRIKTLLDTQRGIMQAVSHELRTPLARMRFKLAFIDEENADQDGETTNPIRKDISQVEQLVDEILEYHKLSQQTELQTQELQLVDILQETKNNLSGLFTGIDIQINCPENVTLNADRRSMLRLTQNLCSNACKHAASKVQVAAKAQQNELVIRIEDDGKGIADEDKSKVFNAFYRADSQINQQKKGYGLGLSIIQQIVRLHMGEVRLGDSELGGALFEVILPLEPGVKREDHA